MVARWSVASWLVGQMAVTLAYRLRGTDSQILHSSSSLSRSSQPSCNSSSRCIPFSLLTLSATSCSSHYHSSSCLSQPSGSKYQDSLQDICSNISVNNFNSYLLIFKASLTRNTSAATSGLGINSPFTCHCWCDIWMGQLRVSIKVTWVLVYISV